LCIDDDFGADEVEEDYNDIVAKTSATVEKMKGVVIRDHPALVCLDNVRDFEQVVDELV